MHGLLELIFPPNCAGCDRPGTLLCDPCAQQARLIDPSDACPRCGAPHGSSHCSECKDRDFAFTAARCASLLEPPVSRAIVLLKDGCERRFAHVLAGMLAEASKGWLRVDDVLVPVPASPAAVRRRGFDHAADIARSLGRTADVLVERPLRARVTADQRVLGREQRFDNRKQAFSLVPGARLPLRVVLVDDVFTTGATFEAAACVLREAGVGEVRALAVARSCARRPAE